MALGDMFSRLMTALGQFTGKGQQEQLTGGGAGADLVPEVMTMQAYWRAFLQEKQAGQGAGGGATQSSTPTDAASMTDLDALLNAPRDGGVPAAPGGDGMTAPAGGGDLDGLGALGEMPGDDGGKPTDDGMAPAGSGGLDGLDGLDALLEMPDDEGEAPADEGDEGDDEGFDWLSPPDDDGGDGSGGDANLSELDALFG